MNVFHSPCSILIRLCTFHLLIVLDTKKTGTKVTQVAVANCNELWRQKSQNRYQRHIGGVRRVVQPNKAEWGHQPAGQGTQSTARKVSVTKCVGARLVFRDIAPKLDLEPSNFS